MNDELKGGVLLNFQKRRITLELDDKNRFHFKSEGWPVPMHVTVAHITAHGGIILMIEPGAPVPKAPLSQ